MNETYIVQAKSLKRLLNMIDEFNTNINKFNEKHKDYSYSIEIVNNKEDTSLWNAEIKITNEKQKSIKAFEDAIEPPTLL